MNQLPEALHKFLEEDTIQVAPENTIDNWAALIHLIRTKARAAIFTACKWTIIAIVAVVALAAAWTIIEAFML